MREQGFLRPFLLMLAGLLVWALHFAFVYGFTAVVCVYGLGEQRVLGLELPAFAVTMATLAAALVLCGVMLAALLGWPRLPREAEPVSGRFMRFLGATIAGLALLAVVWEAVPAFIVPACA